MSIGWFEAFRENGAPTWYGENRTPVRLDLGLAILLWLFLIPTIAFLLILPGIRRFRAISALVFLFSMAVGATLALSIHSPGWHCGQLRVFTAFRAHSRQRIVASLGVNVGLTHVNITLSSDPVEHDPSQGTVQQKLLAGNSREHRLPSVVDSDVSSLLFGPESGANASSNASSHANSSTPTRELPINSSNREGDFYWEEQPELYYNERFEFDDVSGMEVRDVLEKGLPFPILRVVEYLSVDRTGFLWGKQYRLAGYYTRAALWLAFSLWLLQMLLLCLLPQRFGQVVLLCGLSTLFADALYAWHTPGPADLFLVFPAPNDEPQKFYFHLSTCFYATLAAGVASTAVGSLLWLLEVRSSFRLDTFFSAYLDRMCRPIPPGQCRSSHHLWHTKASRRPLPTPKGSFTSLSPFDRSSVGWKRKRRTLRRVATREWPGDGLNGLEMRERAWRRVAPASPAQSMARGDGLEEDCAHQSEPSSSTTSTRPISDSGLDSEEPRSPRTPPAMCQGGQGVVGQTFWPLAECSEWKFRRRERDKGGGGDEAGTKAGIKEEEKHEEKLEN